MKLKKLLAAVTAAALAVSTMAVTSFTASAADKTLSTGSYTSGTLEENQWGPGIANPTITLESKWGSPVAVSNYEAVEVEYTCAHPENIKTLYLVAQNGTMPDNWFQATAAPAASGTITLDFSTVKDKTYEVLLVQIEPADSFSIGDTFEAGFEITSAKIIAEDVNIPENLSIAFATGEIELEVIDASGWGNPDFTKAAQKNAIVLPEGVTTANTYGDLKNSTVTLTGIKVDNVALEGVEPSDVSVCIYAMFTGWKFKTSAAWDPASGNSIEWDLSTITEVDDSDDLLQFGYQLTINGNKGGINDMTVGDIVKVNSATSGEPGEVSVTVTPATADVKAGETVQLTAAVTGKDDAVVTWESTNTKVATVNESGLVTGVAKGSCEIRALVDDEFLGTNTSFSVVTVTEESGTTPPAEDKTFEGSATLAATKIEGWYEAVISKADLLGDLDPAKTTIVFTGTNLTKVGYNSISEADYKGTECNGTFTLDASDIDIGEGYFLHVGGTAATEVTWVATEKNSGTPVTPVDPPATTGTVLWEGNQTVGWTEGANVQIAPAKFADIKVGDTLKFTISCDASSQLKIASMESGWPVLTGPNPDPEWGVVNVSGTSYSFVVNAADVAALKEFGMVTSGQNATVTKIELVPKADPKPPVDPTPDDPDHTHDTATTWTSDATGHWHVCSGCTDKVDFAAHTSDGGTVTTAATETTAGTKTYKCTVCEYVIRTETIPATGSSSEPVYPPYLVGAPVIPVTGVKDSNAPTINGQNGWEAVITEITAASDGDKLVVDMNSATKVPSTVFKAVQGKDVDLVLNMSNGIKWTINGLSVTSTKAIDFDVTKNTKHIPNEVVDKAEGSHKRQISLDHNGSFGCNAVMTYDVGTQYNGLYANLFYYNRKAKELELIDCSPISGGKANFLFTHASDYLITISDEPLGGYEDVSSAAGITSDNSGVNSIAFCSVLAVITLAFGFVVYKKRRHN